MIFFRSPKRSSMHQLGWKKECGPEGENRTTVFQARSTLCQGCASLCSHRRFASRAIWVRTRAVNTGDGKKKRPADVAKVFLFQKITLNRFMIDRVLQSCDEIAPLLQVYCCGRGRVDVWYPSVWHCQSCRHHKCTKGEILLVEVSHFMYFGSNSVDKQ